ncbi:hypothetical protein E2C01_047201 [Portunus trituberculatus]|uniref:Uncharacterized protein n=1 Tax=Portunus trituberculatus TaxID=210409 RepID=A0A5B7G300_PORTR|nr:hypothetical protein [Portunus trituberculatus]
MQIKSSNHAQELTLLKGGGGIVDKVVSVGSGRRPRVGSNPTTYRLKHFAICGYTKDELGW